MASPVPIVLGALLVILTAWCLGRLLLRSLGIELFRLEEDLFAILAGSACLSVVIFLMSTLRLARKGSFTAVFAAALAAALWRRVLGPAAKSLPRAPRVWLVILLIPFAVYTCVYLIYALAPEQSPDGASYHLGSVLRWWHDRGFVRFSGSIYANLSQGLEMLFLFAFCYGRHSSAALVHFAFLVMLPCLMFCYGRRFDSVPAFTFAAIMVYLSPVVGITGTSAYNDVAAACTVFGLFYALQIWDRTRHPRLLFLVGLLAGFAYALKYTAGLAVVFAVGFVAWRLARAKLSIWRPLAIVAGCAAISIVPWMAKNWLWAGNPFSPFFNSWFPNRYVHISFEKDYVNWMALFPEFKSRWELPLAFSVHGAHVGGLFGPWLLLTPLAVLSLRSQQGRRLLAAAVIFGLPAVTNNSTRILLPFAVFAAPALGLVLAPSPAVMTLVLLLHSVISWPAVVPKYASPYAWHLGEIPVKAALRRIPEEQYLSHNTEYQMARMVERLVPERARVFALPQIMQGYTTRQLWQYYQSAEAESAHRVIAAASMQGSQPSWEMRFTFPEQPVRALRVVQTARKPELWSVSEMRLYRAKAEVARRPSWRITARPNAWDAKWAFDNISVTEWCTWRDIEPDMYLEVDPDREVRVDAVILQCRAGQWGPQLRLAAQGSDGRWRILAPAPEIVDLPVPKGLRMAAAQELKSRGFPYVLASREDQIGKDMRRNTSYWGMTLLADVQSLSLYRID